MYCKVYEEALVVEAGGVNTSRLTSSCHITCSMSLYDQPHDLTPDIAVANALTLSEYLHIVFPCRRGMTIIPHFFQGLPSEQQLSIHFGELRCSSWASLPLPRHWTLEPTHPWANYRSSTISPLPKDGGLFHSHQCPRTISQRARRSK